MESVTWRLPRHFVPLEELNPNTLILFLQVPGSALLVLLLVIILSRINKRGSILEQAIEKTRQLKPLM
jgi:hypothetical protein